ncbi:hypothetical protein F5146DRAFT_1147063 [Armillaria mellea]|nr:hypothetical protein F5146DRAFT_1147063 [Armillaria mellea]
MSDSQTFDIGFKTEKPFELLYVSRGDSILGSIVFGFFFGFSIQVVWHAALETKRASRVSAYMVMIWLEILANTTYALTLKLIVIGAVSVVSISTSCIWIPANLQINSTYMGLNKWWDKFEKSIYLLLDLALNILFIRMVKGHLVDHGLKKYDRVMCFNRRIIIVSIGMDVLLMGVTTLKNPFVYTQFHPVTYIVKLQIEMSMSCLLIKVAHSTGIDVHTGERIPSAMAVNITTEIYTQYDPEGQEEYEMSHIQKNGAIGDDGSLNSPSVNKLADDEPSRVSIVVSR